MRYRIETERGDLFDTSIIISMLVRISEDVPFGQMKAAFEKACRVHEVLNTKVVIESSGEAYYVTSDETHNGFEDTDKSIQELIDLNERKRFHIEDGEFIRGFKSAEGILFMMHHLGGDGKSLLYFIETFMRCLNGEAVEPVPFRNLTVENIPEGSELSSLYEMLLK